MSLAENYIITSAAIAEYGTQIDRRKSYKRKIKGIRANLAIRHCQSIEIVIRRVVRD